MATSGTGTSIRWTAFEDRDRAGAGGQRLDRRLLDRRAVHDRVGKGMPTSTRSAPLSTMARNASVQSGPNPPVA